ncbi:hypothetical protein [Campylobacter sp. MG1]|uniref:hypothetical protein n=1 Tax=Campylobacter sp. MG1 TaxID=2976332 RepID=UPI00226CD9DE|nr:hypothetical protein [Campylobacter sp. MG1]
MKNKYILKIIFLLCMFSNILIAYDVQNNCESINNFENFKLKNNEKLKNILSNLDIEIYNKIFKINSLKLINHNNELNTTTCEVTYKFNNISKEEALAYLLISQNKNFKFKNIITILAKGEKDKIQILEKQLGEIIQTLSPTIYSVNNFNQNYSILIIEETSILELLEKLANSIIN